MKTAIDVRDMNTAIHSLYIINSKPRTVAKAFWNLARTDPTPRDREVIMNNTTWFGEIFHQNIEWVKPHYWENGWLQHPGIYDDGENRFKVIESFDIWW